MKINSTRRKIIVKRDYSSREKGINLILADLSANIEKYIEYLQSDTRFIDMEFKTSLLIKETLQRLQVRLKQKIITLKRADIKPTQLTGKYLPPGELKA